MLPLPHAREGGQASPVCEPWGSRGTQGVTSIAAGRGGVSHPHRAHPLSSSRRGPLWRSSGIRSRAGVFLRQPAPVPEDRLLLLLWGQGVAPHALHVPSHSPGRGGHVSRVSPLRGRWGGGARAILLSPSPRQCWGLRPPESPLRPVSTRGPRPPRTPSDSPTPPLEWRG